MVPHAAPQPGLWPCTVRAIAQSWGTSPVSGIAAGDLRSLWPHFASQAGLLPWLWLYARHLFDCHTLRNPVCGRDGSCCELGGFWPTMMLPAWAGLCVRQCMNPHALSEALHGATGDVIATCTLPCMLSHCNSPVLLWLSFASACEPGL